MSVSKPLSVVGDIPSKNPRLGFDSYADAVAAAIRGGNPPQFTIGLYGAWGSGKTSLLRAIQRELEKVPEDIITVTFDAWRYERSAHIIVPLLHQISKVVDSKSDESVSSAVGKAVKAMLFSLRFKLGPVDFDPQRALENAKEPDPYDELDKAFSRPFEEFKNLSAALGETRIAILIDDLDRCSPDNVVSMLESINLVMDVPGLVFVLALDYEVLTNAISHKYPHVKGGVFIQKLIQLPFRVPHLDLSKPNFLEELIPELEYISADLPKRYFSLKRADG